MIVKESNLRIANEISTTFKVGAPDITNRSIRFPAFDFKLIDESKTNEDSFDEDEYYDSAILVFEDVVSSTRQVKAFTHVNQVEGKGTYELVDGPFDLPDSIQEVFRFELSVYANSACAWVDWNIVAVSMRIEEVNKEALIDLALKRGIELKIVKSALEDADRRAISILLSNISSEADHRLMLPLYCEELIEAAKRKNNVPEIADLLIERPNRGLLTLADELSTYHTQGCAALIRDIIAAGYDASAAMIFALYDGEGGITRALLDPSESVRIHAAKKLEAQNDRAGLIRCLLNDSARVREIAGWYIGINKVSEAADTLVGALTSEKFTIAVAHAEIEALRSAIWALGVLRVNPTRPYLEPLTKHTNELIRKTALDALSKLI